MSFLRSQLYVCVFWARAPVVMAATVVLFAGPLPVRAQSEPPNVVFVLVDDLGYMDISPNNPETFYRTPNLDRLAAQGMRFTNGYAASPVCSPTRYSIMTGRYPTRVGATNYFSGTREGRFAPAPLNDRMPLEETTLAEALRAEGYRTAFIGKWHLGPSPEFWPEAQGFEINVGGTNSGMPRSFFSPYRNPRLDDGPDGEYLPERLTTEALSLMERFRDERFLIYLSFYTVHTPLQAPDSLVRVYEDLQSGGSEPEFAPEEQVWPTDEPRRVRVRQTHATYAAMVEMMDRQIGRLLDGLEALDLDERTVVFFMSDNGGLSTAEGSPTSNLPLRGGKGWLYEGGIREPWIVSWPGVTTPGSVEDTPVVSTDFYPTILDIAGAPRRPDQHLDGVSLVPVLSGEGEIDPRPIFFHYPHYSNQGGFPGAAVRSGRHKLIERFEDGRVHLFDLSTDIGEENDLAGELPDVVNALREQLHRWYEEVDARFLERGPADVEPWRPDSTTR